MRGLVLFMVLSTSIFAQVSEEEFRKDRDYLNRIKEALDRLDRQISEGNVSKEVLGELNSYGYPLHLLKDKYVAEQDKQEFYEEVSDTYEKVLYIKRGAFPQVLKEEFRNLNIPFCELKTQGRRRETLVVGIKNPEDEETVIKIMTQTQLRYAHLIGLENLKFEKCR